MARPSGEFRVLGDALNEARQRSSLASLDLTLSTSTTVDTISFDHPRTSSSDSPFIQSQHRPSSDQSADQRSQSLPATMPPATNDSTALPPSIERAYRQKCIELRRRMAEVDEVNDAYRLRKVRLDRAILKMKLERAFLLEQLAQRMKENIDDSDDSSSAPPTPEERPLRTKRSNRKSEHAENSIPLESSPRRSLAARTSTGAGNAAGSSIPPSPESPARMSSTTGLAHNSTRFRRASHHTADASADDTVDQLAFRFFAEQNRDAVVENQAPGNEETLTDLLREMWAALPKEDMLGFVEKAEAELKAQEGPELKAEDEADVDMNGTTGRADDEEEDMGGFTAVNR